MSPDEKEVWLRFIAALEEMQPAAADPEVRRRFARRYRSELVLLSFWLNQAKVTGGERTVSPSPPDVCDLCRMDLPTNGLFIDGEIADGRWSFMCMTCYAEHGVGIGWGIGQLYRLMGKDANGDPRWACIAGGDTEPDEP